MKPSREVSFSSPMAYSRNYPAPRFPAYPDSNRGLDKLHRGVPTGVATTFHVARARYALAMVARALLKPGATVLLPAYHCPAMVEPFLWAGCCVAFYPVTESLAPAVSELELQLDQAEAVVFVHYFGFRQAIEPLVASARERGCLVIEDLAHTAFAPTLLGDVGVTSLAKFFSQSHGSEIWCGDPALAHNLKQTLASYQSSKLQWSLDNLHDRVRKKLARRFTKSTAPTRYRYFNEAELHRPAELCSLRPSANKRVVASWGPLTEKRRSHYQQLLEISLKSSLGTPLYPDLPPDCVPCVFPFLLNSRDTFHEIRNAGIPLFRWEELASTECDVSAHYREHLIQIPCHQTMTVKDFSLIDSCLSNRIEHKAAIQETTI